MTRVVAYIRVSTNQQAERGVSLEAQERKVQQYADLYDLDLVDVVVDAGHSAKSLNRPGLGLALSMLDHKQADALLIVKLDRLTRSVRDLSWLLDNYFGRRDGPALMVVAEQVDTRTAAGRLVLNVLMSVAQWEREAIGERTRTALQLKADRNEYCGGDPPYGWSVAPDGKTLIADQYEQGAIRLARSLRDQGYSLRGIGRELVQHQYASRRGGKWSAGSIKVVLKAKLDE